MLVIFLLLCAVLLVLLVSNSEKAKKEAGAAAEQIKSLEDKAMASEERIKSLESDLSNCKSRVDTLSKYEGIAEIDAEISLRKATAETEIQAMKTLTEAEVSAAKQDAKDIRAKAKEAYQTALDEANNKLSSADSEARRIIDEANAKAKEIAGDAFAAMGKAKDYEATARAMQNIIEGYGDQYLIPTYSLLDELAEDFSFDDAGKELKRARQNSARMVKAGTAAKCDYVEAYRKRTAIAFVVDAFNGKVDSILSKTKHDNYGTLEQKIKDAFQVVNYNGRAFRNAEITLEYLNARLEELKWGVRVSELKARAQEEQRQIREQMREEERARREYEKAMRDAAKEEDMLRKAMEKARQQIETANEAKRAEYEAKLEELKQKLIAAEERGQRAMSMAQQTRHGNVYVISNIGAFGENVFKIGMTRRLEPLDRVKELGDASVPFPFDVHAIIESDDAPSLENDLHKALALMQMNKVNPRKEFFKVSLSDIKALVERRGLEVTWTMSAEATEYRETLAIEQSMKTDPDAKRRWEEYASSIASADLSVVTPEALE